MSNDPSPSRQTHEEICGPDSLIVIYVHAGAASDAIVRWCGICGAVVVDEDYDGRTNAGAYMPMRFPVSIHTGKRNLR